MREWLNRQIGPSGLFVFAGWQLYCLWQNAKGVPDFLAGVVGSWRGWTHAPWDRLAGLFGLTIPGMVVDLLNFLVLFFAVFLLTIYQALRSKDELAAMLQQGRWDEKLESHEWDLDLFSVSVAGCAILAIMMRPFFENWTLIAGLLIGMVTSAMTLIFFGKMTRPQHYFLKKLAPNLWGVLVVFLIVGVGGSQTAQEMVMRLFA
jgi:Na+/proline symporter